MFQFQLDYFRNGQGFHLKTILLSIIASVIMFLLMLIPGISILIGVISLISSRDFFGEPSGAGIAIFMLSILIGFLLTIILYIFVLVPLSYGLLKFYKDTDLGINPRFNDLFMFLKKGRYVKTLKLTVIIGLICIAMSIAVSIVVSIVQLIFYAIFGTSMALMLESGFSENTGVMSVSYVVIMLFMILILFALYIPLYYLIIFIANTILVHIDQRSLPTLTKFSIGWNITSKGPHNAWKLLFSNIIYVVVLAIIIGILAGIFAMILSFMPTALQIIFGILGFILYIIFLIAMNYFIYGSIMNFYHKNKNALYPQNN
ncbi:hypothetical protein BU075_10605 [Mammaliicoccus vitulinus]|uniref:hypothetical protein n=1 Tax=Mammaliicoccus vitulinus TaxID=71237 RepID=UPI000D1D3DA9|nr:hypothetical protein [Mammaliicoccus vitulinus]PTI90913.1 hypothetical protein BU071_00940 [Mammaliicoccus vitulinus]RIN14984.1 hypothetical protein BU075_10605 [Mammaliicoccus vitulinus]